MLELWYRYWSMVMDVARLIWLILIRFAFDYFPLQRFKVQPINGKIGMIELEMSHDEVPQKYFTES